MTVKELIGILEKADENAAVMLSKNVCDHPDYASNILAVRRYDEIYGGIEEDERKKQVILISE